MGITGLQLARNLLAGSNGSKSDGDQPATKPPASDTKPAVGSGDS